MSQTLRLLYAGLTAGLGFSAAYAADTAGTPGTGLENLAFEKQGYYTNPVDPYVEAKAKHLETLEKERNDEV